MDDELTYEQQAEIDEALDRLTARIEAATVQARHELALLLATRARDEVALLERLWVL